MITATDRRAHARFSALVKPILVGVASSLLAALPAQAEVARIKVNPSALILDGVRIRGDVEYFFLSGQLPSPVDPAKQMSDVKSLDDMGDSKAQTISTLNKIKALLKAQGYEMSDLVKLTLFVAADPRLGRMDFAGVNEGFRQFFGTAENPETVARSTFQVAALVGPHYLIEIEAVAARDITSDQPQASYQPPHRLPAELRKKALLAQHADGDSSGG